jgi:hypothetical protein
VFVFGTIEVHSGRFMLTVLVFVFTCCPAVFLLEIAVQSASGKSALRHLRKCKVATPPFAYHRQLSDRRVDVKGLFSASHSGGGLSNFPGVKA